MKNNVISICTYNGYTTPAYILTEMLKTHEYFMTDDEICLSMLYERRHLEVITKTEQKRLIKIEQENNYLIDENEQLAFSNELIAKKKKYYRKLIDEMPVSIFISRNSTILYINEKGMLKFEINDSSDIIGQNILNLIVTKDKEMNKRIYQNMLNNETCEYGEVELLFKDGNTKFFQMKTLSTWFDGENAMLHILIDLTRQKLTEKVLIRSEKLNVSGQLAAGIAHEIRNPLTSLKGFFKLIKNNEAKDEFFKIIDDELDKIEQISGELLILAKPHSDIFKVHPITNLIESVKTLLETQAIIKGNEIVTTYEDTQYMINCEETKIKQVFINIIKNAIEATENGSIIINVRGKIDKVEIKIIDNGCGMPKEVLNKLLEPFFSTKEKGTGLGLLICEKIIESHNGTMHVESKHGVGTTFTISFPMVVSEIHINRENTRMVDS